MQNADQFGKQKYCIELLPGYQLVTAALLSSIISDITHHNRYIFVLLISINNTLSPP